MTTTNTTTTTEQSTRARRRAARRLTEEDFAEATARLGAIPMGTSLVDRLREGAAIVRLETTKPGKKKKLRTDQYAVAVDEAQKRKRTAAEKRLFNHPAYKLVDQIQAEGRRLLELYEIEQEVLGDARYLIPIRFLPALYERLEALKDEHDRAVADFVAQYPEILVKERADLGALFRAADYPHPDAVASEFQMRFAVDLSDSVERISPEIFHAEHAKFVARWEEDLATMRAALRVGFARVVDAMVERLTPEPGESGLKTFKNSLVENMQDFLLMFDDKNVATNDGELQSLVEQARRLLSGVTPEDLREQAPVREAVASAMSTISSRLDGFVEVRQRRIVRLAPPTGAAA